MGPCDRLRDPSKFVVLPAHHHASGQLLLEKMEGNRDFDEVSSTNDALPPSSLTSRANMSRIRNSLHSSACVRSCSTTHENLRRILRILCASSGNPQISTGCVDLPQFMPGRTGTQECPENNVLVFLQSKEDEENAGNQGQGKMNLREVDSDKVHDDGLGLRLGNSEQEKVIHSVKFPADDKADLWECERELLGSSLVNAKLNVGYEDNSMAETYALSHHDSQSEVVEDGFEADESGGSTHMPTCQRSNKGDHMDCIQAQKDNILRESIQTNDGKDVSHGNLELLVDAISLASGTLFEAEDNGLAEDTPMQVAIDSPNKVGKKPSNSSCRRKQMRAEEKEEEEEEEEEKAEASIFEKKKKTEDYMLNWYADFEDFGPLVRSKRGRNQVLPSRFRDSVLEPWKRVSRPRLKR